MINVAARTLKVQVTATAGYQVLWQHYLLFVVTYLDLFLGHPHLWMKDLAMWRSEDRTDIILVVLRIEVDGLGLWIVELDRDACMTSGLQPVPGAR